MSDFSSLALIILIGAVGNTVATVQKGKNVAPVLLANVVLFLVLALIGSLWSFSVAKGLGTLYLIGTLLGNGIALTNTVTSLATGIANTAGAPKS